MAKQTSPLRVICTPLLFGHKRCVWKDAAGFRGAEFTSRKRSGWSAIVHPSTKTAGKWQVSYFDADGPVSDSQHGSATDALAQLSSRQWKLKDF